MTKTSKNPQFTKLSQLNTNKLTQFNKTVLASAISLSLSFSTMAAEFNVTENTDDGTGLIADTLSWAILQANTTSGDDVITLNTDVRITGVMKRLIDSNTMLHSDATKRTIDGDNNFRPLFIKSGNVLIENIDMINGMAKGGDSWGGGRGAGMGGSIFVYNGSISIRSLSISNSQALPGVNVIAGFYGAGGGGMYDRSAGKGGGGMFVSSSVASSQGSYGGYGNYQTFDSKFGEGGSFINDNYSNPGGFGGGGALGYFQTGSAGGFGGGGGLGYYDDGGKGGFGAGGGTTEYINYYSQGQPGYGGNAKFASGMGGAIFIRSGNLNLLNVSMNNNQANATDGAKGLGGALFIMHSTTNSNGNNQGMPSVLPTVSGCGISFNGNAASGDTGAGNNNDDIFDLANIYTDQGVCVQEIEVIGNNQVIDDGDVSPNLTDDTDFENTFINNGITTKTFTINNQGGVDLNLTGNPLVAISGIDASEFSVSSQPNVSTLTSFSGTTFEVTFTPTSIGLKTATISIDNDDSDENPYDFTIQGMGQGAEIEILGNALEIVDGDTTATVDDGTDFESVFINSGLIAQTFTINNISGADLNLTGNPLVAINGVDASEFSITNQPVLSTIAGNSSTSFEVTFAPTSVGLKTAIISIDNDDSDENPYDFVIQGTGQGPEINVTGNSISIIDGDTTPEINDFTDFGPSQLTRSFSIENTGVADLTLTGLPNIALTGADAGEFSVTIQPSSNIIGASSSLDFEIEYSPTGLGIKTATVTIENDDIDEGMYSFAIQGGELQEPEIEIVSNGIVLLNGDNYLPTEWNNVAVTNSLAADVTFTINNTGNVDLNMSGLNDFGVHSFEFTFVEYGASIIPANSSTNFIMRFNPFDSGLQATTLTISSNDPDEGTFEINLFGIGIPLVSLSQGTNTNINEGEMLNFYAGLDVPATSDIPINYTISGDVDSSDFMNNSLVGNVTITSGDTGVSINLLTQSDGVYEGPELVMLTIQSPSNNVLQGSSLAFGQIDDTLIFENGFEQITVRQLINNLSESKDTGINKPIFNESSNSLIFFDLELTLIAEDALQNYSSVYLWLEQVLSSQNSTGDWDADGIMNQLDDDPFARVK